MSACDLCMSLPWWVYAVPIVVVALVLRFRRKPAAPVISFDTYEAAMKYAIQTGQVCMFRLNAKTGKYELRQSTPMDG